MNVSSITANVVQLNEVADYTSKLNLKNKSMNTDKTSLENEKQPSCLGAVSCRFCKHFKEDVEYADLGMCQNEEVMNKLIFSFCDSFLLDADFGCKWFVKNGR